MKITLAEGVRWYPGHGYLRYLAVILALLWMTLISTAVTTAYMLLAWCRELDWFNLVPIGGSVYQFVQWPTLFILLGFQLAVVLAGGLISITGLQHSVGSPGVVQLLRALVGLAVVQRVFIVFGLQFLTLLAIKHAELSPIVATIVLCGGTLVALTLLVGPTRRLAAAMRQSAASPLFPDDALEGLDEQRIPDLYDRLGQRWERPAAVSSVQKLALYASEARRHATTSRYAGLAAVLFGGTFVFATTTRLFSAPTPSVWQFLAIVLTVGTALAGHRMIHRASMYEDAADEYVKAVEAKR